MSRVVLAALTLVVVVMPAGSSHLRAVTAFQPTSTERGIEIAPVTFLAYGEALLPGEEVKYTSRPYLLPVEGGEPRNHNAAALAGIVARTELNPDFSNGGLFGDTLRVVVDTSGQRYLSDHPSQRVLDTTIRAALWNAARSCSDDRPSATWIEIRVVGTGGEERRVIECEELQSELPN